MAVTPPSSSRVICHPDEIGIPPFYPSKKIPGYHLSLNTTRAKECQDEHSVKCSVGGALPLLDLWGLEIARCEQFALSSQSCLISSFVLEFLLFFLDETKSGDGESFVFQVPISECFVFAEVILIYQNACYDRNGGGNFVYFRKRNVLGLSK